MDDQKVWETVFLPSAFKTHLAMNNKHKENAQKKNFNRKAIKKNGNTKVLGKNKISQTFSCLLRSSMFNVGSLTFLQRREPRLKTTIEPVGDLTSPLLSFLNCA